jgi:KEOPS complex subunit Cgi121
LVHKAGIKSSEWTVFISGFKEVSVDNVDEILSLVGKAASPCIFQLLDADLVAGWKHLYYAAVNAVRAFETETAISKSLAIEALLYASCQDQISQALDFLGVKPSTRRVVLLLMGHEQREMEAAFRQASELLGDEDDTVLEVDSYKFEELRRLYSVSELELEAVGGRRFEALTSLLIERGALLPVRK